MKKVLFSVAFAAFALASCGDAAELAKKLADSLRNDSIKNAEAMQHMKDSLSKDSADKAMAMEAAAARMKDSLMKDSIDKASKKGGTGSKPKPAPTGPKVGKPKPGANK